MGSDYKSHGKEEDHDWRGCFVTSTETSKAKQSLFASNEFAESFKHVHVGLDSRAFSLAMQH